MQAAYVPPRRTPLSFDAASEVLGYALQRQLDRKPSDEVLALALAKTSLETGRYLSIWNEGFGNVKSGPDYRGMFTCITLNEVLVRSGKKVLVWFAPEGELSAAPSKGGKLIGSPIAVPDGHPQTRMRAYANEFDGAISYVEFVAGGRYKAAWAKLLEGDPAGYVHALKVAGYFTADEALYRKGVVSLYNEALAKLRKLEPPPKVDIEWERLKLAVPSLQFDVDHLLDGDFEEAVA
jgi:hypothetical protein